MKNTFILIGKKVYRYFNSHPLPSPGRSHRNKVLQEILIFPHREKLSLDFLLQIKNSILFNEMCRD